MDARKSVTLAAHRAVFRDDYQATLQSVLVDVKNNLRAEVSVDEGLFANWSIKFPESTYNKNGFLVQFGLYEQGAQQSTIRNRGANEGYVKAAAPAPSGTDYLQSEVLLLVENNLVVSCGLGKRHAALVNVIGKFCDECGVKFPVGVMSLEQLPNKLNLERIRSIGVNSFGVNATDYLGHFKIAGDGWFQTLFGGMETVGVYEQEKLFADIRIRTKGKSVEFGEVSRSSVLDKAAEQAFVSEQCGDLYLELRDGSKWRGGELILKKTEKIAKDGSTYRIEDAIHAMSEYFRELKSQGMVR
jgi:hypothetical protein